jgi:hypothetical protein
MLNHVRSWLHVVVGSKSFMVSMDYQDYLGSSIMV